MSITADFSGAFAKTATMLALPEAAKKQMTAWTTETVRMLKAEAGTMQKASKYPGGHKTGQLARNIGFVVEPLGAGGFQSTIGTGVKGTQSVKYAWIQDQGGTTHPRVTPRMRKWAWWAYSETGNAMYKGIALTKKSALTVKIPGSGWFTKTTAYRERFLPIYMSDAAILKRAEAMAGKTTGGT